MTKTKISTMLTSILLLVAMCFSIVSCTDNKQPVDKEEKSVETDVLETEFLNSATISLKASSPMVMATETGTISQKLTATITPATATNQKVDWNVAWADEGKTSEVSDFIVVTPDSDGSTSATVTCKAAFEGNIVITVTTRQNSYKAVCVVTFVGVPANITVSTNLSPTNDAYPVVVGNAYQFGIGLSNPFGNVGSEYQDLQISVSGKGQIKVASKEIYKSGGEKWYEDRVIDFASIASNFLNVSFENNIVNIYVVKSIESYYAYYDVIDSGRTQYYQDCFREYVSDCSFEIVLTEPKSGITNSFYVVIDPNSVTNVSLDANEMLF